jgi:hypothetical protein
MTKRELSLREIGQRSKAGKSSQKAQAKRGIDVAARARQGLTAKYSEQELRELRSRAGRARQAKARRERHLAVVATDPTAHRHAVEQQVQDVERSLTALHTKWQASRTAVDLYLPHHPDEGPDCWCDPAADGQPCTDGGTTEPGGDTWRCPTADRLRHERWQLADGVAHRIDPGWRERPAYQFEYHPGAGFVVAGSEDSSGAD